MLPPFQVEHAFSQFAGHLPAREAANASLYAPAALNEELVLLEKEWLIQTGQASTPDGCWELRAV